MQYIGTIRDVMLCGWILSSCTTTQELVGSGHSRSEERSVGNFSKVDAEGDFKLKFTNRAANHIQVQGDDNLLYKLTSRIDGETLMLRVECDNCRLKPKAPLVITISAKGLEKLLLAGNVQTELSPLESEDFEVLMKDTSKLTSEGIKVEDLKIELSHAATVNLSGRVDDLEVDAIDDSVLQAKDLEAKDADVYLADEVKATLDVVNELEADLDDHSVLTLKREPAKTESKLSDDASIVRAY